MKNSKSSEIVCKPQNDAWSKGDFEPQGKFI